MRQRLAPILITLVLLAACGGQVEQVESRAVADTVHTSPQRAEANDLPIPSREVVARQQAWYQGVLKGQVVDYLHGRRYAAALFAAAYDVKRRASVQRHPAPTAGARSTPTSTGGGTVWDRLAACESGGNWASTAGTYEGGVQFLNSTWLAMGGGQYAQHAYDASRSQQIAVAERLLARSGWGQWPVCSRKIGVR